MHFSLQPNPPPQFRRRKPVATNTSDGAETPGADGAAAGSPEAKLETGGSDGQDDTETNAHEGEGKAEVAGTGSQHAGEAGVKPDVAVASEQEHAASTPDTLAPTVADAPASEPAPAADASAVAGHDHHAGGETLSSLATALHGELAASLPEVEPGRLQQIAQSLAQQAQEIRPTDSNTDFGQGKSEFESKSKEVVQQMLTMQNLSLKVDQMMKIAEMIAKIAKKAIENYDVK